MDTESAQENEQDIGNRHGFFLFYDDDLGL